MTFQTVTSETGQQMEIGWSRTGPYLGLTSTMLTVASRDRETVAEELHYAQLIALEDGERIVCLRFGEVEKDGEPWHYGYLLHGGMVG